MITQKEDPFLDLKKSISRGKKIVGEMQSFNNSYGRSSDINVSSQIKFFKQHLKEENEKIPEILDKIILIKKLETKKEEKEKKPDKKKAGPKKRSFINKFIERQKLKKLGISDMEKDILKRIEKKKKEVLVEREKKPNVFAGISSRFFSEISRNIVANGSFDSMIKDLLRTNMQLIPAVYISIILFSSLLSFVAALFLFAFLLFFNISSAPPFITPVTDIVARFLSTFWMLFVIPLGTFFFMYVYPSLERKSLEAGIDQELPFATINMSAIAGSKIEPTNIFRIIVSTGEYPHLKMQFTKIINEINIYGHDLVTALRSTAFTCPSKKLSDLYNGLATNITSGGNLAQFFQKRSQSLLLDYRLERERETRSSETFIDVYISIVIAAPMILMLLLVMIQISGLGISLSPSMLSLVMVMGVAIVNVVFLMFLRFRQPSS
jgi:flagellar protein FlaJ